MPAGDDSPFASAVFERSIPHRPHAHAAINPSAKDRLCAIFNINFAVFGIKYSFDGLPSFLLGGAPSIGERIKYY